METYRTVKMGLTRFTIIRSKNGVILIDTVPFAYRDRFYRRLKRLGITTSQITAILLTHHHEDHTGIVASLLESNPKARLIFHAREEAALLSGRNQAATYANHTIEGFSKKANVQATFTPLPRRSQDLVIGEEESPLLRDLGIDATLLHTSGHTPGSVCILFDDRTLIAGDTFANIPLNLFKANPFPFVYEDRQALLRSWKRILSKKPERIVPSHGRTLTVSAIATALKIQENQSNLSQ